MCMRVCLCACIRGREEGGRFETILKEIVTKVLKIAQEENFSHWLAGRAIMEPESIKSLVNLEHNRALII